MKRLFPSMLKLESNEEQPSSTIVIRMRKRGKMYNDLFVYKRMVSYDGYEIDSKEILDITNIKPENIQNNEMKENKENKMKRNLQSNDKENEEKKYIYYEFVEQSLKYQHDKDPKILIIDEEILTNRSEDSYDDDEE